MRGVLLLSTLALLMAGCSNPQAGPTEAGPTGDQGPTAAPGSTGIITKEATTVWTVAVGVADRSFGFVGSGSPIATIYPAALNGTIFEMDWTPSSPLSEQMQLVLTRDEATLASVSGASPLRIVLEGDSAQGEIIMKAAPAAPGGATADQECRILVTMFKGVPFDPDYSALAG